MSCLSGRNRLVLAGLTWACLLRAQSQGGPFEAVPEAPQPQPGKISGLTIQAIDFRGAVRFPESVLAPILVSRAGGIYDVETLRRDSQALYNTGRYSDITWETEPGGTGVVVHFRVVERSLIQSIEIQGDTAVTVPEVSKRLKQRKIKLRAETLLDEGELSRAAEAVQELVLESDRRNATVAPSVEPDGPPLTVRIVFRVGQR